MSEAMHPYCFAVWDEADPAWRTTRNADAADAYYSEPCSCGHCAACSEREERDDIKATWPPKHPYMAECPRCGNLDYPAELTRRGGFCGPCARRSTHETPERETLIPTRAVSRRTLEG